MAKYEDFDDGFELETEFEESKYADIRDEYIERPSRKNKRKKPKSKNWIIILVVVLEVIVLVAFLGIYYVVKRISSIERPPINEDYIVTNPDIKEDTVEVLSGYTNILLLGSDNRLEGITDKENHTDAILIASINNDTKEVRIVSVYRDTILEQGPCGEGAEMVVDKATEAAFFYGLESSISMINKNMDLDIDKFIMLNWSALIELVDAVGGVDLEITQMEQRWTNRYLVDTSENTGVTYTELIAYEDDPNLTDEELFNDTEKMSTKKKVHMDGIQATSYARVRFGDGLSDYGRTRRQRDVINQIVAKAKNMSIGRINSIVTALCKNLSTNLETTEILGMIPSIMNYKLVTIDSGFPFTKNDQHVSLPGCKFTCPVIPTTLESNVIELHRVLFDDENYVPSETVKSISNKIIELTGVSE